MLPITSQPVAARASVASRAIVPDLLKAAAIFGVVFIHSSAIFPVSAEITQLCSACRFCVPAFITIWAYFQERTYLKGGAWWRIASGKLYLILVPFVAWSALYSYLATGLPGGPALQYISRYWSGYGWSGQYFFIILLQLIVLFPIMRQPRLGAPGMILVVLGFAAAFLMINMVTWPSAFVKISYRPFVYWIPYVMLGVYLARNRQQSLPWYVGVAGILLILVEPTLWQDRFRFDADYVRPGLLVGSALLCGSFLNRVSPSVESPSIVVRAIWLVGASTMGIFVINPLLVFLTQVVVTHMGWGIQDLGEAASTLWAVALALGVVVVGLGSTRALRRVGLGLLVS